MVSVELLKQKASGLSGAISPGDARAVAKLFSDVCEHLGVLENEISDLRGRLHDAEKQIAQLRDKP
jgi:hypothetical protein